MQENTACSVHCSGYPFSKAVHFHILQNIHLELTNPLLTFLCYVFCNFGVHRDFSLTAATNRQLIHLQDKRIP